MDEILYEHCEDLTDVQHIKLRTALQEYFLQLIGEDDGNNDGLDQLREELRGKLHG